MPGLRRIAFSAAALLLVVVLVVVVTVVVTVRRPLPDWSGAVEVPGLAADVEVLRDARGVPQIYADTASDLFYAQGYVHAQDRFFEMDLRRHITAGRLSELVGENPDALQADRVVRTLGWRRVAEQELPLLAPSTRDYLQSYADGVNAYVEGRSPADLSAAYSVLDVAGDVPDIEPWTPVDSLAWLKAMAWDLRSNYDDELGRALAYERVGDTGGVEAVNQLYPAYPTDTHLPILPADGTAGAALAGALRAQGDDLAPADVSAEAGAADPAPQQAQRPDEDVLGALGAGSSALASARAALDAVPALLGRGDGIGSNSWVVSGAHTASGRPLLANDPHLGPAMPSIWYQVGLHCTQVDDACPFEVAGFSFSGMPGVVIGHNADIAWGMTNLGPDVTDFFLEDVDDDGTYLRDGEQVELDSREETIRVAGGADVPLTVRSTVHGPIVSDVLDTLDQAGAAAPVPEPAPFSPQGYEVALSWTALTPGRTADAVFALNQATNWDEFRSAAELFEVPAQNLVYADTDGNIGYQAPGKIPVRRPGSGLGQADGTWPRPGWNSDWDWEGYIPFQDLPSVRNPAEGFVVAANQQVIGSQYRYRLTTDWDYGYRSQRIRDVLTERIADGDKLDAADMNELQNDTVNGFADALVPSLLAAPPVDGDSPADRQFTTEAVTLLRDWDGQQPATQTDDTPDGTSAAAAYFNAVWSNLLRLTFQDQLPPSIHPDGGSRWFQVVTNLLADKDSVWWDDATTPTITESRDQVIGQALKDARLELTASLGKDPAKWEWGKLHTLQVEQQPLGGEGVPGPVRALFNSGTHRMGGGSSIVLATGWNAAEQGSYTVDWVPSMRMVVDLDDLNRSTWVDLTGVSGHPWSGHYGDQTDAWAAGETYPWPFKRQQVEKAAEDTLTLRPRPQGE